MKIKIPPTAESIAFRLSVVNTRIYTAWIWKKIAWKVNRMADINFHRWTSKTDTTEEISGMSDGEPH